MAALAEKIMNKIVTTLVCAFMASSSATAATLDASEIAQVKLEITSMYDAFEHGDAKALLAKTHESLYKLTGGKEAFEKATQQAVDQLRGSGIKFLRSELGTPTQTYVADEEEVCFVPRVSVMEIQGKQAKSTGFMIAIRKLGTDEWKYLDGAGLRKNPDLLYLLMPKLERGIELPPVSTEFL
jgi:hypothetical protein